MANVVLQVAIGSPKPFMRYSENTWRWWAQLHQCDYIKLTSSKYPAPLAKLSALRALKTQNVDFERVLVVDYDTLIRAHCPLFLGSIGDGFYAVPDLGNLSWIVAAVKRAMKTLGPPPFGVCEYFNSGLTVMDVTHFDLVESVLEACVNGAGNFIRGDHEQTYLNYAVRRASTLKLLPLTYNLSKPSLRGLFKEDQAWRFAGDVLHFNETDREQRMEEVWHDIAAEYSSCPHR